MLMIIKLSRAEDMLSSLTALRSFELSKFLIKLASFQSTLAGAAVNSHLGIVKTLIAAGAKVDEADPKGHNPIY